MSMTFDCSALLGQFEKIHLFLELQNVCGELWVKKFELYLLAAYRISWESIWIYTNNN